MKYRENAQDTWHEINIKALDSMEIGCVIAFAGDTIPTGWLVCDGSSITQSAYPELYALIGGTLPDFKGKTLVGKDSNDTDFDTLLETGGYKGLQKHTHQSVELGGNTLTSWSSSGSGGVFDLSSLFKSNQYNNNQVNTGNVNGNATDNGAPSTATNGNLQPYAVINWIIKATNTTPTMASVVNATNNSTTDGYSCDYSNKHYGGVVLYENESGSYGCTLSETSANFTYLDIHYKKSNYQGFIRVYNPNGKSFGAQLIFFEGDAYFQVCTQNYTINGTSITKGNGVWWNYYYNGQEQHASSTIDQIQITRVVGYK